MYTGLKALSLYTKTRPEDIHVQPYGTTPLTKPTV